MEKSDLFPISSLSLPRIQQEVPSKAVLEQEMVWMKEHLSTLGSPVVLCHNDLLCKNIIHNSKEGRWPPPRVNAQKVNIRASSNRKTAEFQLKTNIISIELYFVLSVTSLQVLKASEGLCLGTTAQHITEDHKVMTGCVLGHVHFIDYEYSSYNYQAFDIGNHFNEFAGW